MTVANHLTLEEVSQRVKKAKDPLEKARFLAVSHAKQGLTAKEIARITLNTPRWVQATVRRYNQEGAEALQDRRHRNPGPKPKLTLEEQKRVLETLKAPPPDGGLWSGPKLFGSPALSTGRRMSRRKRSSKKLRQEVEEAHRESRRIKLLAYDEHRLYEWFYLCTFVEPKTGWNLSLLADGMDTQVMGWVLRERKASLSEGEEAWVVLDRAGWHVFLKMEVPEGVKRIFLPPYSPELQPAKRVWPLVNEGDRAALWGFKRTGV